MDNEQIVVIGRNPVATCIDDNCFLTSRVDALPRALFDNVSSYLWSTVIDWLSPPPTAIACTIPKIVNQDVRTKTSRSDDDERFLVASAILQYLIQGPAYRTMMNGKEIQVTFSDGGTQTYVFFTNASAIVAKNPPDLVRGDGISKCP